MSKTKLVINACAKINLGLRVLGKRSDGYHEIETLFQSIDLHDTLTLELTESAEISLEISSPWALPKGQENLVYRAAELIRARFGIADGVHVRLEKRIPVGAGLGGGSSDAAATLVGLNELFRLALNSAKLQELALQLGSDVPYFFVGGLCRGRGRGELLEKLPERLADHIFVLTMPPRSALSTAEVYRHYDELCRQGWQPPPARLYEDIDCANDLEDAALALCPALHALRKLLKELEPELWGMSGSGPTYYAAWASSAKTQHAAQLLAHEHYAVYLARPTPRAISFAPSQDVD